MSALGQKRTLAHVGVMSALHPEADICACAKVSSPYRGLAVPEITGVAELRHFVTADTRLAVLETPR